VNIPDEAAKRYPTNVHMRNAFTAGAEWARKEALREAADDFEHVVTSDDGTAWFYKEAADSLRALAEGEGQ